VADERAHRFRQRLAKLRADNAQVVPVRVFYQVWGRPLLTVSANHVIDDALRSCKAENLFADRVTRLPRPTRESVLLADPDAIIAADASEQHVSLAAWRRWPRLRAVALGNLYTVDPNLLHRHTPRILDGVASLCSHVRSVRRHR
jgi:iron complex transport system substrate-binding protein